MHHEAHIHMNSIYSDAFMDMEDLFTVTAPPSRTTFVADPVVIIKNKIRDDFIIRNAVDTTDPTTITPLWARCSFSNSAGNCYTNRHITPATLKEAIQCAIAYSMTHELKITTGIQALHFRPGLNYLQWGTDVTDSATGFAVPTAPPTPDGATPAAAPAPAPPLPTDVAAAVAHAVTTAIRSAPAPSITVTTPTTPSTKRLRMLFNPASLPVDVRTRFQHKQDRKSLLQ